MARNYFHQHFGYGSFLSLVLFLLGNYTIYLFMLNEMSKGILLMLFSVLVYIINNVLINKFELENNFNNFLENVAVMLTFGVSTIIFGVIFYQNNVFLLLVILFYSVCIALSLARNRVLSLKNSLGWPVPLNGIFFPVIYFFYLFYFGDEENTIFIFYYVIISILSISSYNFLGRHEIKVLKGKEDRDDDEEDKDDDDENNENKDKDAKKKAFDERYNKLMKRKFEFEKLEKDIDKLDDSIDVDIDVEGLDLEDVK